MAKKVISKTEAVDFIQMVKLPPAIPVKDEEREEVPLTEKETVQPSEPEQPVSGQGALIPPSREGKESSRKRRTSGSYRELYLKHNEIKVRHSIYISHTVYTILSRLIYILSLEEGKISLSGYIDNVLTEHLEQHREDINELYSKEREKLY